MKILSICEKPIYRFPCVIVAPGGRRNLQTFIPVVNVIVDQLPDGLEAVYAGSDFQAYDTNKVPPGDRSLMGAVIAEELTAMSECSLIPDISKSGMILAGDLYADPHLRSRGGLGDVHKIWDAFGNFKWVCGVAGNHDSFKGSVDIPAYMERYVFDGGLDEFSGIKIGGLSGITGKEGKPWRRSEKSFMREVDSLVSKKCDFLILHEGPDAPEHSGWGNSILRSYLEKVEIDLLVFSGHCHWQSPYLEISENVQVLNLDFRLLILTEDELDTV